MTKIRFLPTLNIQMNLILFYKLKDCEKVCICQFVDNQMYSYIYLHVFPVLWHFEKKYTTTVRTIILKSQ